ncbi:Asp-tRNA(Asn)/Glu-tRNA(Gln) amidotransferase subunit GatC [Maledivibacter halophilus]|uniref:Aspartyl/glutamyl-tRNA(Asn/Gln) amidotransferase subunit C n=1 Tax=Maledivibacter halophilus TaxID=36842 RepID=A0A1T5MU72_9FIRM|nr:Asp-tRNA(Asn)/Glu-tRNA(Gln) amidotransferase subunit GatC [Maledivibacter halophilus]SKC91751.1 aspartyl/glutamyl-tRNA(Asn/Gln) amidotransferase subunit C [Maledivibacter halophilus]
MKVNIETIEYIAKLAKLKFTREEAEKFASEFQEILAHFQNIDNEDLKGIDINTFEESKSVLRKDEVKEFDNKKELFQNTKKLRENYISIPKVME